MYVGRMEDRVNDVKLMEVNTFIRWMFIYDNLIHKNKCIKKESLSERISLVKLKRQSHHFDSLMNAAVCLISVSDLPIIDRH